MYKFKDKIQINTLPIISLNVTNWRTKSSIDVDYYAINLNDYVPNFISIKNIDFNLELYSNKGAMSYNDYYKRNGVNSNTNQFELILFYKTSITDVKGISFSDNKNMAYVLKEYADNFKTLRLDITPSHYDIYKYFNANDNSISIKQRKVEVKDVISFIVNIDYSKRRGCINGINEQDIYIDYKNIQKGSYEYNLIAFICISYAYKIYESLTSNTGYFKLLKS